MVCVAAQWRMNDATAAVLGDLKEYGEGAPLDSLSVLSNLIANQDAARHFVANWAQCLGDGLQRNPLGLVPFRHQRSAGFSNMQLAMSGRAVLSVLVYEKVEDEAPAQSAVFNDAERSAIVIEGKAMARLIKRPQRAQSPLLQSAVRLCEGSAFFADSMQEARQICGVEDCLVVLQLSRAAVSPRPTCEMRIADGKMLQQSSGDKRTSHHEMAMAVLGAMERTDAAPILAEISDEGPDHLRWEAMRQALHLDPAIGFGALSQMAGRDDDSLSSQADTLRSKLVKTYPQLMTNGDELCPS